MNPIEAVTSVIRNFANFNGRAQRSEFWWFALFSFLSQIILGFIPFVGGIYSLVLLLPSLAVTARRLHDTNRTAWWMLLYLIPVLGLIVLVIVSLALLGINSFDPWEASDAEWGVIGILFLIWLLGSFVAWLVLLIFQIMPGTVGPNRYGPDPLRAEMGEQSYGTGFAGNFPPYAPAPPPGGFTGASEAPPHPDLPQANRAPEERGNRRYCAQCGTQLQPEARFCTNCGTAV